MSTTKTILIGSALAFCLFYNAKGISYSTINNTNEIHVFDIDEAKEIASKMHGWECKYIIQDGYHDNVNFHYVNEITVNVGGSISFVDDFNISWTIPAPYYWIYINEKKS